MPRWPSKPPTKRGPMWITWVNSWKARWMCGAIAPPKAGFGWRASPSLKPSSSSVGTGQRGLTVSRCKITSASRLSRTKPTSSFWEESALGYAACLQGYSVLFASAIDVINTLAAAKSAGRLKVELKKYTKPALLILDELGYLPIDKVGADLLFQVISLRYEQGAMILTSNRAFKEWPTIFNHDSTLTSAVLDRLLHHADTISSEGKSFRMKDQLES